MMWFSPKNEPEMPEAGGALQGRAEKMPISGVHYVNGSKMIAPFPEGYEEALFGLGCFWGAERKFWQAEGVYTTAVGYAAGYTPNPTYEETCTGRTGHNEVVLVVFDPKKTSYDNLLKLFWEGHNPTQGMKQGADVGTQYRSGIYVYSTAQEKAAKESKVMFQQNLSDAGHNKITTEIISAPEFYYAEEYHQQYLAKNPNGYCGLGGTGVRLF
ncbi:MAG: peptide-methionine (S)-S-oxide reductase MsrA [Rhodospirillales bacterium]|nr:peptide-methionine (S)-S-oxide reductase MsrA [Rhodospirillales bacterium]